jgi:signal transduction histidine kinase
VLALFFVGGVYLVTRRAVDRALRPVAEMAEQAAQWSAHDVTHRFGDSARPAELRELAAKLDSVLNRIGAVLRHEQQLAAELSHELKTPLSVIVAENDLLAAQATDVGRRHGHEVISRTAERMNELLDTLLADAGQRITESPGLCSVEPVIRAALADAIDTTMTTTVDVTAGLEVGVSKEIVGRILSPLLSNACRYATSQIAVRAHGIRDTVEIVVADDGPGLPTALRSVVFDPGTRGNPADGHPGPGLGLALARRLARSSGGDITLLDVERGGAFSVVLPAG